MANKLHMIVRLASEDYSFVEVVDETIFDNAQQAKERAEEEIEVLEENGEDDIYIIEVWEISSRLEFKFPVTAKKVWQEIK